VFLDADVRISSSSLRRLIDTQRRVGGLVSVQPWHDVERPYQRLSIMFNIVAVMGSAAGAPEPSTVFGPVLITDVSDYKRVGGHAAVRGEVVEDLALGRQYRELDIPTTVFVGDRSVAFRMYSNGIAQLIEGWTKNFALGAGATPIGRMSAIVLWVASLGTASIRLGEFLLGSGSLGAVAAYALSVLQFWVLSRRVGRFGPASALLLPLHLATFLLIFARSAWCTVVRRRVTWRGRSISLNEVADPR
jgi:4,4'-diaponeurosporenoate glycosyltransferase